MANTYEDDDKMLNRIVAEATPGANNVSMKLFEIRKNGGRDDDLIAQVVQVTYIAGSRSDDLLASRRFTTQRGADRWLNAQR